MTDAPSPLGRYDARTVVGGSDNETHEIRLLGVPVDIFRATREQHDELMREFAVMALARGDEDSTAPPELRRLSRVLGVHYAPPSTRTDEEIDEAVRSGRQTVDLSYRVTNAVIAATDELESLMASADDFCHQGRMLTMPRSPIMRRFSAWWLAELRGQVSGRPPAPLDPGRIAAG